MVGHMHEDMDQLFSYISRRLLKLNVLTLPDLLKEIGKSYTPAILMSLLKFMFDVKDWLETYAENDLSSHVE